MPPTNPSNPTHFVRSHIERNWSNVTRPFLMLGLYPHNDRPPGPSTVNVTVGLGTHGIDPVFAVDLSFDLPWTFYERSWRTP